MKSPEKNECIDIENVANIMADKIKERLEKGIVSVGKNIKTKMTTFWVSPTTWKHVQDRRELGETVDECLRRLMGIRGAARFDILAEWLLKQIRRNNRFPPNMLNMRIVGASFDPRSNMVSFDLIEIEPEVISIKACVP